MARVDGDVRAGGDARYTADVRLPGMVYTALVTSPHPHAMLLRLDVGAARELPEARFVRLPGIGHELPPKAWGAVIEAVVSEG